MWLAFRSMLTRCGGAGLIKPLPRPPAILPMIRPKSSTGGGIRTHTLVPQERILSPQRLPFRHAGNRSAIEERGSVRHKHTEASVTEAMRARPDWYGKC
jgi:hypothetical protein